MEVVEEPRVARSSLRIDRKLIRRKLRGEAPGVFLRLLLIKLRPLRTRREPATQLANRDKIAVVVARCGFAAKTRSRRRRRESLLRYGHELCLRSPP